MEIIPIHLKGDIQANSNIVNLILASIKNEGQQLNDNDVLVVAHKIISKSEGTMIDLKSVRPSRRAVSIAKKHGKDSRITETILRESKRIVKMKRGIIITETKHGFVCANAGVDKSNVNGDYVALLPKNPDRSAERIRRAIKRQTEKNIAVIISDTFGRPFREGQVNVAIGISGMKPIKDYRGSNDMFGNKLRVSEIAVADEIASAAELVMGKTNHVPMAIIRGLVYENKKGSAKELIRDRNYDLFR
jgi:coenzyme F420-0:L-glutamate ligase/coenzyme F420-1:gamma-L-glutamate ligase